MHIKINVDNFNDIVNIYSIEELINTLGYSPNHYNQLLEDVQACRGRSCISKPSIDILIVCPVLFFHLLIFFFFFF